jgi:hypothetical protein
MAAELSGLLGPVANVLQLAVILNFVKGLFGEVLGGGSSDSLDKLIEFMMIQKVLGGLGGGGGGIDLGGLFVMFMPMLMFVLMFAILPRMLGK